MKAGLYLAVAALLLVGAAARCPNGCSGHGNCGESDKCSCWANWQGPDCSLRTCAYDIAWATDHWANAHYYAECSGKGLCDRETGECVCFEGYTGRACKRSVCPNDCSGHGKCRLVEELPAASKYGSVSYTDWDGDKIQACVCDGGFYGPDCSQRYCPKGDDPMTICKNSQNDTQQVQLLTLSLNYYPSANSDSVENDELALKFTDNHNETWWTQRISGIFSNATASADIKEALESIPNFKIPEVEVNPVDYGRDGEVQYLITFLSERNSGNQTLLQCDFPLGCMTDGCQPMYKQPRVVNADAGAPGITADSVLEGYDGSSDFTVYDIEVDVVVSAGTASYNTYSTQFTVNGVVDASAVNHGRIPNGAAGKGTGYDHAVAGHGLFLEFTGPLHTTGTYTISYAVPKCTVVEVVAANSEKEDIECSGRGSCDAETGTCSCFEGYYGDHCYLQTILV